MIEGLDYAGLLAQLQPAVALLVIALVAGNYYQWRSGLSKDTLIEKLRVERNDSMKSKDEDLKTLNQVVIDMTERNIKGNELLSNNVRASTDAIRENTAATRKVNDLIVGMNAVLTNIAQKNK